MSDTNPDLEKNIDGPSATEIQEEMTPEQLEEARRYGRAEIRCVVIDRIIDLTYLAVAALVLAVPVTLWLENSIGIENISLQVLALFAIMLCIHIGVSFPLSYYSGHVLEHRFGLSNQSLGQWLWRYAKGMLLSAGFGALTWIGLFWIIRLTGPWWWLAATGAYFALSIILGQLFPVLIQPLFHKIEPLDDERLKGDIEELTSGVGLRVNGLFRILLSEETKKANAMLAGLGRTRRVLLSDTLLDGFSPEEIKVILAHEIGHHFHRHIWKMLIAAAVYCPVGFWICNMSIHWFVGAGYDPTNLPVNAMPMVMLTFFLFSQAITPLQLALCRHFERQADRYALVKTGLKDAYISAFRKLAVLNKDDPDPHSIEVVLLHSHPPIARRIEMAEKTISS